MYKRSIQGWLKHIDFIIWDVLILQASYVLGYMIRHGWGKWPYLKSEYRVLALILAAVDVFAAVVFNTMHDVLKRSYLKEITASIKHVSFVLGLMSLYLFSTQTGDAYSRITIYLTAGFHLILGYLIRILWKPVVWKFNKGKSKDAMILVAGEKSVQSILQQASDLDGFEYAGIVFSDRDGTGEDVQGIKVVSSIKNAADYICREWVDEVFVYPEYLSDLKTASYGAVENLIDDSYGIKRKRRREKNAEQSDVAKLIEQCREMAIPVHICLPFSDAGGKSFMEEVGGYSVLTMTANCADPYQVIVKRLFDILGGLVGSLIALILIAVLGPMIKKESPGPILFRQTRIGQNGKRFTIYKLRSMYTDAEERKKELMAQNRVSDGRMFKLNWDPRIIGNKIVDGKQVTGIGEKIRSASLDEFPQFFNILKGDMSLVGTRPPTVDEWEKYRYHHRARLATKPGLTGLWQVSGRSRITDFEEVVKLDTKYINNWSMSLDFHILLRTIKTVIKKEGAM